MKVLLFFIFIIIVFPVKAVDFYRCVDTNGISHFTNLPASSLNSNCEQKDNSFSVMLSEDYENLAQEFAKYEINENGNNTNFEGVDDAALYSIMNRDNKPAVSDKKQETKLFGAIKIPTRNIFDPDVAEEELFTAIEDRDDAFTRAIRGRTKALETVIETTDTLKSHNKQLDSIK